MIKVSQEEYRRFGDALENLVEAVADLQALFYTTVSAQKEEPKKEESEKKAKDDGPTVIEASSVLDALVKFLEILSEDDE